MKSIIYLLTLLTFVSCAEKKTDLSTDMTKVNAQTSFGIEQYDGYWALVESENEDIIQIYSKKDATTGNIITKADGLNLQPDLPYLSSAFASEDCVTIENHDGRNEGLIIKTLNSVRQLITIGFNFTTRNELHITIEAKGLKANRLYKKMEETLATTKTFNRLQFARARKILSEQNANKWYDGCDSEYMDAGSAPIVHQYMKCVDAWIAKKPSVETLVSILKESVKTKNIVIIERLLLTDIDVNLAFPQGATLLRRSMASGFMQSAITGGEHGFVTNSADIDDVFELLKSHGLRD